MLVQKEMIYLLSMIAFKSNSVLNEMDDEIVTFGLEAFTLLKSECYKSS